MLEHRPTPLFESNLTKWLACYVTTTYCPCIMPLRRQVGTWCRRSTCYVTVFCCGCTDLNTFAGTPRDGPQRRANPLPVKKPLHWIGLIANGCQHGITVPVECLRSICSAHEVSSNEHDRRRSGSRLFPRRSRSRADTDGTVARRSVQRRKL